MIQSAGPGRKGKGESEKQICGGDGKQGMDKWRRAK